MLNPGAVFRRHAGGTRPVACSDRGCFVREEDAVLRISCWQRTDGTPATEVTINLPSAVPAECAGSRAQNLLSVWPDQFELFFGHGSNLNTTRARRYNAKAASRREDDWLRTSRHNLQTPLDVRPEALQFREDSRFVNAAVLQFTE